MDKFQPESSLLAQVAECRNELLGSVLTDVWEVVTKLQLHDGHTYDTDFRMADFADFVLKVAEVVSTAADVEGLLERLGEQQVTFATEDDATRLDR